MKTDADMKQIKAAWRDWRALPEKARRHAGVEVWEPDALTESGRALPVVQRWFRPLVTLNVITMILATILLLTASIIAWRKPPPAVLLQQINGTLACPAPATPACAALVKDAP